MRSGLPRCCSGRCVTSTGEPQPFQTRRTQQKQYPAAVKALQRAVALDPTEPDAHYRLGRVYQLKGKKAEAEQEFAKTRELHQKADAAVVIKVPIAPQPP